MSMGNADTDHFTLVEGEGALIIRKDLSPEMLVPGLEEGSDPPVDPHMWVVAVGTLLSHESGAAEVLRDAIRTWFTSLVREGIGDDE
jgi:hypothetical protein